MVPLPEHEYFKDAIGDLVKDLAEELAIEYECFGSTTWRRQSAWEVQNLITAFTSRIYGRFVEDWTLTWPLTLPRFGIGDRHHEQVIGSADLCSIGCSRSLGYDQKQLRLYQLVNGMYIETETSLAFAEFPVKSIPDLNRI